MRVHVESTLGNSAARVWKALLLSETLQKVSRPLISVAAPRDQQLPARWQQGETARFRLSLLGVIPIGVRTVYFECVDDVSMQIQTREHDALVRTWDHRMQVIPGAEGSCRYFDDVEIHAGVLTLAVWLFAQLYYHHRQRRWRHLAKRLNDEM